MTTPDHIIPPLRDAGSLETMARAANDREEMIALLCRAMAEADSGESFPEYPDIAESCLTAIANAGYAIVPREPTPEMLACVDDEDSDKYVARGRAYSAWKAMIANRIKKGNPMKDAELIRKLLDLAGDQDIPEDYRGVALAGLNRIEALRSRLSQYEHPEPDA